MRTFVSFFPIDKDIPQDAKRRLNLRLLVFLKIMELEIILRVLQIMMKLMCKFLIFRCTLHELNIEDWINSLPYSDKLKSEALVTIEL